MRARGSAVYQTTKAGTSFTFIVFSPTLHKKSRNTASQRLSSGNKEAEEGYGQDYGKLD